MKAVWLGPHTFRDEVRVRRRVWIVNQTLVGIQGCEASMDTRDHRGWAHKSRVRGSTAGVPDGPM